MNELLIVHPVHQWIILIIVLQIQEHNEKECPRAELKCPFHVVGCAFEVQQAFIYIFPMLYVGCSVIVRN